MELAVVVIVPIVLTNDIATRLVDGGRDTRRVTILLLLLLRLLWLTTVLARRVVRMDCRRRAGGLLLQARPVVPHLGDRARRVVAIRDHRRGGSHGDEAAGLVLVLEIAGG